MIVQIVKISALIVIMGALASFGALAQEEATAISRNNPTPQEVAAKNMGQLLDLVKQGRSRATGENTAREKRFAQNKTNQAAELTKAKAERTRQEQHSALLEKQFEDNELLISAKQAQLKERLGTQSELFGHLTTASGDLVSQIETSLVSTQFPNREPFLKDLIAKVSVTDRLPNIAEVEHFWFEMLHEIKEQGTVTKFSAEVATPSGELGEREIVRIGTFNIIDANGNYLAFNNGRLSELPRQPNGVFTAMASELVSSTSGMHQFGIDPTGPTGGSFLAAIIDSPTFEERWHQGGYIGYAITAIGVFGFLLAIFRLLTLAVVSAKVSTQLKSDKINSNNPLGRVLAVYEDAPDVDTETLELKMAGAVLHEGPKLEAGLTLLKIIAAIAPLMGLLGTVTGMIVTFQAITIFGAGDPKAMAGGISGALVTTVLGLLVAIPTVLLHTILNGRSQHIIYVLDEQATSIIAAHAEREHNKR